MRARDPGQSVRAMQRKRPPSTRSRCDRNRDRLSARSAATATHHRSRQARVCSRQKINERPHWWQRATPRREDRLEDAARLATVHSESKLAALHSNVAQAMQATETHQSLNKPLNTAVRPKNCNQRSTSDQVSGVNMRVVLSRTNNSPVEMSKYAPCNRSCPFAVARSMNGKDRKFLSD